MKERNFILTGFWLVVAGLAIGQVSFYELSAFYYEHLLGIIWQVDVTITTMKMVWWLGCVFAIPMVINMGQPRHRLNPSPVPMIILIALFLGAFLAYLLGWFWLPYLGLGAAKFFVHVLLLAVMEVPLLFLPLALLVVILFYAGLPENHLREYKALLLAVLVVWPNLM